MTFDRSQKALENIAGEYTLTELPSGKWEAFDRAGRSICLALTQERAEQGAKDYFARQLQGLTGAGSRGLGETTRDVVL